MTRLKIKDKEVDEEISVTGDILVKSWRDFSTSNGSVENNDLSCGCVVSSSSK